MRVFIGMETSGMMRRAFQDRGHAVISCDLLPADDGELAQHLVGDVFEALDQLKASGWWPDLAIFHPTCTMHTVSAAWAFMDPDYLKHPGVGYHQRVKPSTLVGQARRDERLKAEADIERIAALPIEHKVLENPKGTIPTRTSLGKPQQIIQPYELGEDASKATCLWIWNLKPLVINPVERFPGRMVMDKGKPVERWGNQTDAGQNKLSPGEDRWKDRSATYPKVAAAFALNWG